MGKRFYCDYCDKSFPDSSVNRRNHFKGIQHQQARRFHYDKFLDPTEKLVTERNKKCCISFQKNGVCNYGLLCRYSHLTVDELRALEEQSIFHQIKKSYVMSLSLPENVNFQLKSLESKLLDRSICLTEGKSTFRVPPELSKVDLPPSLCFQTAEKSSSNSEN